MGSRPEQLKAEIERTKENLAGNLSELKQEAGETQRKVAKGAGIAVGAYVGFKVLRWIWRTIRS